MSKPDSIESYLKSMPEDRCRTVTALRKVILTSLPQGYVETFNWGMIAYEVPLLIEPKTYNGKPLMYAALANQKNHIGVYLAGLHAVPGALEPFRERLAAPGKKLDMDKACIRLKQAGDIDHHTLAEAIRSLPVADFIAAMKR
jgi:hypothetical protein